MSAAMAAATFQPLTFATLQRDGRLIDGPANSSATAAPVGRPAASRPNANGISRNVGNAKGTANAAVIRIAAVLLFGLAKNPGGNNCTTSIDNNTPITKPGIVRTATTPTDRANRMKGLSAASTSLSSFLVCSTAFGKILSITGPTINTASNETSSLIEATAGLNNRNVSVNAAGLRAGEASIIPRAGPRRDEV